MQSTKVMTQCLCLCLCLRGGGEGERPFRYTGDGERPFRYTGDLDLERRLDLRGLRLLDLCTNQNCSIVIS
jgi:hypothetical protein